MFAIIKTGGKQYRVRKGDTLRVELLENEVGSQVNFAGAELLAVGEDNGALHIKEATAKYSVAATIADTGREKKITIIKFQRRKDKRLKQGHRQSYTELRIDDIAEIAAS